MTAVVGIVVKVIETDNRDLEKGCQEALEQLERKGYNERISSGRLEEKMGIFLNSRMPYEAYKEVCQDRYFVDKSMLIEELLPAFGTRNRHFCVTRPRRFGKTVMANMVGAYFGRPQEEHSLFDALNISCTADYTKHLHQHDVVYIDFSRIPSECGNYSQYIGRIRDGISRELEEQYPDLGFGCETALWDAFQIIYEKTGKKFVFVMDEWDAVFHMPHISEGEQIKHLAFLKNLLKDQIYVELAYMTGILPIAKYSDGSELNMFLEYNMATAQRFSEYFGFSDKEVDSLFAAYLRLERKPQITREELRFWYDGYYTASGDRMYNPRSIVSALSDNQLRNYWTSSGAYDSVFEYIKGNVSEVRDDLALMLSGEAISTNMLEYAAANRTFETKDEIYSAMVVYGLLTYRDGYVSIPNRELMESFAAMIKKEKSLGYVYSLANASRKMLAATLAGDTQTMSEILEYAHDTESPILSYNSEIELSAVVNLVYLEARDSYRVEREEKAGEGFVDFIFYPQHKGADGIILELKIDHTPEEAIRQIKDKKYALRFKGRLGEKPKYTGRILAVGICYDRKTKEHCCKVEVLEE